MSKDKIYINPEELEGEIQNARGSQNAVSSVKYSVTTERSILSSIDAFKESIDNLNEAIQQFSSLTNTDINNLEAIKGEWLHLDNSELKKILGG